MKPEPTRAELGEMLLQHYIFAKFLDQAGEALDSAQECLKRMRAAHAQLGMIVNPKNIRPPKPTASKEPNT